MQKKCTQCSATFNCGSLEGSCWCMNYEPLVEIQDGLDCFCSSCLLIELDKKTSKEKGVETSTNDYYIENGYYVFTEAFHRRRGFCCKNGCRHCPYGINKEV